MQKGEKYITPLKLITLFGIGALSYGAMEVISRGYTHISMGLLGGLCFVFIDVTGVLKRLGRLTLLQQLIVVTMFITTCELICGLITNLWLGMNIWDYSDVPFNFKGQICLPFIMLWFVIAYMGTLADKMVRGYIFSENITS